MNMPPRAQQIGMTRCPACGLACRTSDDVLDQDGDTRSADFLAACPRCDTRLQRRKPASMQRTLAYLLAGIIFYIPANVLPVTYTRSFGTATESTILSGILDFWRDGAWDIAAIIFIASVVVPSVKFVVLGLLLFTVRWRNDWARRDRSRLYRLIEFIGYWSMLDVLVVALVAALVRFQALSNVEPRAGIFFFGMVVIFTMLSAMSFDPRLIWDDENI